MFKHSGSLHRSAIVTAFVALTSPFSCSSADAINGGNQGTLNVQPTGADHGIVISEPAGISCGASCSTQFPFGSSVVLTATPNEGATFVGWGSWGGVCQGASPTCTLAVDSATLVTPMFRKNEVVLPAQPVVTKVAPFYVSKAGGSEIIIHGSGFEAGAEVTVAGTPVMSALVMSETQIKATVATGTSAGCAVVQVKNPSGKQATLNKGAAFAPTTISFANIQNAATAEIPFVVKGGDFDGDGTMDALVGTNNSGKIQFLKGKGDGALMPAVDVFALPAVYGLEVTDLDGDGKLDAVAISVSTSKLAVLMGKGDGTFTLKNQYATGMGPQGLALADFNGDGKLDAVTGNNASGSASLLLGKGDGSFQDAVDYPAGATIYGLAMGDINNDTYPDVVLVSTSKSVYVLTGKGDGTLNAATTISSLGSYPTALALGDITGDGKLDLSVADLFGKGLLVRQGDGAGGFATPIGNFDIGAAFSVFPAFTAMWDINLDGKLDVFAVHNTNNGQASYWLNQAGSFPTRVDLATGQQPNNATYTDMTGDCLPDLVVVNLAGNSVGILVNTSQ